MLGNGASLSAGNKGFAYNLGAVNRLICEHPVSYAVTVGSECSFDNNSL